MNAPFDWMFAPYNQKVIEALNEKHGSTLSMTCNACPVQVEGILKDGRYLYFRERHGEWELAIGKDVDEAVGNSMRAPLAQGENDGIPGGMDIFAVAQVIDTVLSKDDHATQEDKQ